MKYTYEESKSQTIERTKDNLVYAGTYLKDDKASIPVRLCYTSPNEFDLATVHKVSIGEGKYRNVSCIRRFNEPVDNCPLCKSGTYPSTKFYLKGITYITNEQGQLMVVPFVFERSKKSGFADKVAALINEYREDLPTVVFKLTRYGKKGDTNTTYDLVPANPKIYTPEQYPMDFSVLEGIDVHKRSYMEKTFEELQEFVITGQFPQRQVENNNEIVTTPTPVAPTPTPTYNVPNPQYGAPQTTYAQPQGYVATPTPTPTPQAPSVPYPTPSVPYGATPPAYGNISPTPQEALDNAEENPFPTAARPRRVTY